METECPAAPTESFVSNDCRNCSIVLVIEIFRNVWWLNSKIETSMPGEKAFEEIQFRSIDPIPLQIPSDVTEQWALFDGQQCLSIEICLCCRWSSCRWISDDTFVMAVIWRTRDGSLFESWECSVSQLWAIGCLSFGLHKGLLEIVAWDRSVRHHQSTIGFGRGQTEGHFLGEEHLLVLCARDLTQLPCLKSSDDFSWYFSQRSCSIRDRWVKFRLCNDSSWSFTICRISHSLGKVFFVIPPFFASSSSSSPYSEDEEKNEEQ